MSSDTNPGADWVILDDPEAAGWDAAASADLRAVLAGENSDCMMVVQAGRVVFTHGDITHKYLCHSIRKSFLSALIGQDVAEGRIRLEATLAELGIDDNDGLSEVERQASVHDLLMARSGIYHPAGYETEWMQMIKEKRHSHAPGTCWCYNNWDFNALGTIFVQETGKSVAEAFAERIAGPVGMQDFAPGDAWTESFTTSRHDAYPFRLSSRDLARFGQLFLQHGRWSGRMLLPEGWAEESVMPYSHAGHRGAYGYCWWLERDGVFAPRVCTPSGSYAAVGAGGHYCMIIPAHDMVVVHRVDTDITGRVISKHGFGRVLKALLAAAA